VETECTLVGEELCVQLPSVLQPPFTRNVKGREAAAPFGGNELLLSYSDGSTSLYKGVPLARMVELAAALQEYKA
jgi:hypothetical protein